jgi:hypothetical protein
MFEGILNLTVLSIPEFAVCREQALEQLAQPYRA